MQRKKISVTSSKKIKEKNGGDRKITSSRSDGKVANPHVSKQCTLPVQRLTEKSITKATHQLMTKDCKNEISESKLQEVQRSRGASQTIAGMDR